MTTPVTPAEVEALEALLAHPGGPEFAVLLPLKQTNYGDVEDGYGGVVVGINPCDADHLAIQSNVLRLMVAATNALPRLLAALRAQDAGVLAERDKARAQNAELIALLRECLTLIRDRDRVPVILDEDVHLLTSRLDAALAAGVAALKPGGGAGKGGCDA